MFHARNLTPEWNAFEMPNEKIVINKKDINYDCETDWIAIGCPHTSKEELERIYNLLCRYGRVRREMWIFTSRKILEENKKLVDVIESFGAKVFADTCMVVSPATNRFECVMVNSGKALEYTPKLRGVNAVFGDLEECIRRAVE